MAREPRKEDTMRISKSACVLMALLAWAAASASGADRKISRSDLPPAVQKAADAQMQGGTVRGYSTEVEDGQREYEMQLMVDGHSKDVSFAPDGSLLEIEEQVNLESLAPSVRGALQQRAGSGKIVKIESLTKHGAIVAYEAQVMAGGKRSEIQVGPGGERLSHEE
jgi:hypothetical protein